MAETARNHEVYSCPHELYSCGYVAFVSKTISLCHQWRLLKTKLLYLAPPDHDTNSQACLAATQIPPRKKSEEIEDIARASVASGEVEAIGTTYPMVILSAYGRSSRNLLIQAAAYDTVQQRTIIPIQEMKAAEMEMSKRIMVRMPNRNG